MSNKEEQLKISLVSLNAKYVHSALAPWYLRRAVQASALPVDCAVVEGTVNEQLGSLLDKLEKTGPAIVGFSCYIWNIAMVHNMAVAYKKRHPQVVIILGGPEVSFNAAEVLQKNSSIDYIISGEGEEALPALLDCLLHTKQAKGMDGVCGREVGGIYVSSPAVLSAPPLSPYTDDYFAALGGRIAYFESSRGCPYSCAFCLSGKGNRPCFFDVEECKSDLVKLANSGTQTIKFVDRTFNCRHDHALQIWRFILEEYGKTLPKDVCFHFEIAGDILTEEELDLLAQMPAGAVQLEIGLQSFNPKTLEAIYRKTNVEKLRENIRQLVSFGNMHVHIDLIAGLPYEDLRSFADSFNTAFSLRPSMLQLGFLKLLHGAAMRDDAASFPCEFSPEPPYEVITTPWLSQADFVALSQCEDALERLYNSGRFLHTIKYLLDVAEMSPFDLFCQIGAEMDDVARISLDDYTKKLMQVLHNIHGVQQEELRDALVIDRLTTTRGGRMPECLKVEDARLKKAAVYLGQKEETRARKGVPRGVALLYGRQQVLLVDYDEKPSIMDSAYKYRTFPFAQVFAE